jgi:signal peptidase I
LVGWVIGLALVLGCGWCLLGLAFYLTRASTTSEELGMSLGAAFSLGLFLMLEWNHWLSRLMGLRYDPHSPGWQSAILLWLLGVPGLLFRSTQARADEAQTARDLATKAHRGIDASTQTDSFREIVETVVFVVVLVLMLKSFAAEAFVIPTGSMAETLYGYQKEVTCPMCGYKFPVNTSGEVEKTPPEIVVGCVCPNCRYQLDQRDMPNGSSTGDRVLVAKFFYDLFNHQPDRLDVVVFKYPERPQPDYTPMNYIKRCIGRPGETIGIYYGKLYYLDPSESYHYEDKDKEIPPERLWEHTNMHVNDPPELMDLLKNQQKFKIIRKAPGHIEVLKRLVYDNDHPAKDLTTNRWMGENGSTAWVAAPPHGFKHAATTVDAFDWLRYHHILRDSVKPQLITDFLGYNSAIVYADPNDHRVRPHSHPPTNWVGDLIIDCEATIEQAEGELVLEVCKGVDRFRATWDLATGDCALSRVTAKGVVELEKRPTNLRKGTHHLRFANVDDRLVVWVDKNLPFGDGVTYEAAKNRGPTKENDLEPASIGVSKGAVTIQKMKLWRDTYYTLDPGNPDYGNHEIDWTDPSKWDPLRELSCKTIYVQPGHYLCMGDNSPESSDGRQWGLVPERLMLGRALMVYFPLTRAGRIK